MLKQNYIHTDIITSESPLDQPLDLQLTSELLNKLQNGNKKLNENVTNIADEDEVSTNCTLSEETILKVANAHDTSKENEMSTIFNNSSLKNSFSFMLECCQISEKCVKFIGDNLLRDKEFIYRSIV